MFSLDYCLYSFRARFSSAGSMAIVSIIFMSVAIGVLVIGALKIVDGRDTVIKTDLQAQINNNQVNKIPIETLDKNIKENPENMQARLALANKLIDANKLERVYAILNAFETKIDQATDLISLGRIYMRLGRNKEAVRILSKIQPKSRSYYESSFLIGEAKLRLQDYRGTLKAAQQIEGSNEAKFLRARAFYAQGRDQDTKRLIKELVLAKAFPARLWRFRARIALDENHLDDAFEASKELIDAGGSAWDSQLIEVEIAIREGRFEDAQIWLDRLESKPVNYPPIRQARALLLASQGEYRAAASIFDELKNWSGSIMPRAHLLRAALKLELGDQVQARMILSDHSKNAPNDWRGLFLLSQLMLEADEISGAKEIAEKISILAPQIEVAQYRHYQVAMYEGRYHDVREILMGLPSKNNTLTDQYANMAGVHTVVRQSLFGPKAKMVIDRVPHSKHFRYLRTLTEFWNNNAPQKALAFYEVKTSPCADAKLQKFQTHCEVFQQLFHVELLLANLKTDEARFIMDDVAKQVHVSPYAIRLLNRLDVREGNPEIVTARLNQYYRSKDKLDGKWFEVYPSQYFGELLVFHYLQNDTLEKVIELTRADVKLLENAEVFTAIARAVIAVVDDKGSGHLKSSIYSTVKRSNPNAPENHNSNNHDERAAIHFVELLANYGVTFHRDLDQMLLSAKLYELIEALPQAGAAYRELLLAYTDDWRAIDAFVKFMNHKDRRASGRSFAKVVLSRLPDNANKEDAHGSIWGQQHMPLMKPDVMLTVAMDLLDGRDASKFISSYRRQSAKGHLPVIITLSNAYHERGEHKKSLAVLKGWLLNHTKDHTSNQQANHIVSHGALLGRDALYIAQALRQAGDVPRAAAILENAIEKQRIALYQYGMDQSDIGRSHGDVSQKPRLHQLVTGRERLISHNLIMARARLIVDKTPLEADDPEKSQDNLSDVEFARWAYLQQSAVFKSGTASFYYQQALIKAGYHEMATILANEVPKLAKLAGKV